MIKVGYLGVGFNRHSTGYLCRDIVTNHQSVEAHFFHYDHPPDDETKPFRDPPNTYHSCHDFTATQIAELIKANQIDILVFLDATTRPLGLDVLLHKPAPVILSWLGGNTPGIPQIDGIIADPVLIPNPSTYDKPVHYLPVFCGIQRLSISGDFDYSAYQKDLAVESDTRILYSAAPGYKRSDQSIEAHCQILAQTDNSVLVIKGIGDPEVIKSRYLKYGDPLGVSERIRFLDRTDLVEDHRAQLAVADLFLDTWPYSAATHAVESLALGIPVLTMASGHYYGRQAASLLMACSLPEMVASDDQDYVRRAVEYLGSPVDIQTKVRYAHQVSPLFNPRVITQELERIYGEVGIPRLATAHTARQSG